MNKPGHVTEKMINRSLALMGKRAFSGFFCKEIDYKAVLKGLTRRAVRRHVLQAYGIWL